MRSFFVLGIFLLFNFTHAFEIPENKTQFVLDSAQVLTDSEENLLRQIVQEIQAKTTAQVAIFTTLTIDGRDIAETAVEIGRKWGVGQKEKNNGVLIFIAVKDREWFIATGYGAEGAIPDALAKRIGENHFPENFRTQNYYNGLVFALGDIEKLLLADPSIVAKYKKNSDYDEFLVLFGVLLAIGAQFFLKTLPFKKRLVFASGIAASSGIIFYFFFGIMAFIFAAMLWAFLLFGKNRYGGKMFDGGSSGGGGFGGGSFGGGGARGRW